MGVPTDVDPGVMSVINLLHGAGFGAVATLTVKPRNAVKIGVLSAARVHLTGGKVGYDTGRSEPGRWPATRILR